MPGKKRQPKTLQRLKRQVEPTPKTTNMIITFLNLPNQHHPNTFRWTALFRTSGKTEFCALVLGPRENSRHTTTQNNNQNNNKKKKGFSFRAQVTGFRVEGFGIRVCRYILTMWLRQVGGNSSDGQKCHTSKS